MPTLFGVDIDPELAGAIIAIVALVIVVQLALAVVRGAIGAAGAVASFTRKQVKEKFWRDSGRLATVISLLLLVLAYGLFGEEQSRSLGDALLAFGWERLLEVLPIAILTQVVLICGFWLLYGYLLRVPGTTLADPFKIMLWSLAWLAWLAVGSVTVLLIAGDDPGVAVGALVVSMVLAFLLVMLVLPRTVKAQQAQGKPRFGPMQVLGLSIAIPVLFIMPGSLFTIVYLATTDDPTVAGMVGFVAVVVAFLMLIACYRFRAYIGKAEVPPAIGYLIDFSLAISALAVTLAGRPGGDIMLGGLPAWVVAVGPALLVALAVFAFNLVRLRSTTPRWALCLAIAVIAGLLVGPAKAVLAPALTPIADLLPLPGFVDASYR